MHLHGRTVAKKEDLDEHLAEVAEKGEQRAVVLFAVGALERAASYPYKRTLLAWIVVAALAFGVEGAADNLAVAA